MYLKDTVISVKARRRLTLEMVGIFILFPAFIYATRLHNLMVPIIWLIGGFAWYKLEKQGIRWGREWNASAFTRATLKPILIRFFPNAAATFIFTWFMLPGSMFGLIRTNPVGWMLVMIFYPLLSVIPQEIIFRSFFLRRYASVVPSQHMRLVNAIIFGWVHIIMRNWIAMIFSSVGGWMFVDTYQKHRSLALTSFEHSLYGCFVFTIGLGVYFYHGSVR